MGEGVFKDRGEKARYISVATFKRLRCTEVFEGDCLISRLPDPVGRSCILPDTGERMITAVDCTILRFNLKQLLPAFFNHYSQSDEYLSMVAKECTGTTRSRISRGNLALTPIPVPPLPEQQRIVGILDEAFAGIATAKANAEKNLQNARALFESHLQSVFTQRGNGWVDRQLASLCHEITVGHVGSMAKEYKNSAVPFLRSQNIRPFEITLENVVFIDKAFHRSLNITAAKEVMLHVPPIAEQHAIIDMVDSLRAETQRLARLYERKLGALDALKKSLLHQAFSGQL